MNTWRVRKIVVVGPGIVGMPMAAMLAHSRVCIGSDQPAQVVVLQRNSNTSGWKVDAINAGRSVIGGLEPELDRITRESVDTALLRASHDPAELIEADVILICVQTDRNGNGPDYGPMMAALTTIAAALRMKPNGKIPLIIFESTLAPSTMVTVIQQHFARYGLIEGRDILLGNSPNRVMPGRLIERVAESDKLIGGLQPRTVDMISHLYAGIVTRGTLHPTNSITAELVKTLENAYRDIRIAFSAEIVRYCDAHNIDYYQVREDINRRLACTDAASANPLAVPTGSMLIPTIGVGGHCLPKDGILMSWRRFETQAGSRHSLVMAARAINDASPGYTVRLAEDNFGILDTANIALLGTAYRFDSEDTRNSPTLPLARLLINKGCRVTLHDFYVKASDQNLQSSELQHHFTNDLTRAISNAEYIFFCAGHRRYADILKCIADMAPQLRGIVDGCNLFQRSNAARLGIPYTGIGRGSHQPEPAFIDFVFYCFRALERGVANEVQALVTFLNQEYGVDDFNCIDFTEVQRIARTCVTCCDIVDPAPIEAIPPFNGFMPNLVRCAHMAWAAQTN